MFTNYDFVQAEHEYRADKLRREMRKGLPSPSRRALARLAIVACATVAGISFAQMSAIEAADAAVGPNANNHLATSWQMYEPTWQPNYQLLEQILNGGETNRSNHGDPVTTVAGPR